MTDVPATPWIHIGECPFCVNGLCRVRTCHDEQGHLHLYAMCDECEALWTEPSTDATRSFPDLDKPECPICGRDLFGEQSHWSTGDELVGTEWLSVSIFDVPSDISDESVRQDMSDHDDIAYGQDDPKPGC